jgi:hypothetical protein
VSVDILLPAKFLGCRGFGTNESPSKDCKEDCRFSSKTDFVAGRLNLEPRGGRNCEGSDGKGDLL